MDNDSIVKLIFLVVWGVVMVTALIMGAVE